MKAARSIRPLAAFGSVVTALLALACGNEPPAPSGPPDGVYAVRGEIVQLPRPGGHEVMIRHEAIPDLKDAKGKVVGMDTMTMTFGLGADVDRSQLAAGGRYSFTLEVRWNGLPPTTVRGFTPLPAGTRLSFDVAEGAPPAD